MKLSSVFLILAGLMTSYVPQAHATFCAYVGEDLLDSSGNEADGTLAVIDAATNAVVQRISVGKDPSGVVVSASGDRVYVAHAGENTISVIETPSNAVVDTIVLGGSTSLPMGLALSPDDSLLFVSGGGDGLLYTIDTSTHDILKKLDLKVGSAVRIALNPSGTRAYVAGSVCGIGCSLAVVDTTTNSKLTDITVGNWPADVVVTPDGQKVYVSNADDNTVSVIDAGTNSVTRTIPVGIKPLGLALNPAGTRLYVANSNNSPDGTPSTGNVSVIDTSTDTVLGTSADLGDSPADLSVTPDGNKVYAINMNSWSISVLDADVASATTPITHTQLTRPGAFGHDFIGPNVSQCTLTSGGSTGGTTAGSGTGGGGATGSSGGCSLIRP